ncbi:MAG: hypothetical protein K2M17_03635 [Bacilli bacterium]|nr:hypothetical protein [Bacilli bacterium]
MKEKELRVSKMVIITLSMIGLFLFFYLMPKKDNTINESVLKELLENNDKISYILQGDVKTTDGFIKIGNLTYYYLEDEYLKDIKSLNDIHELISNTFIEEKRALYESYLNDKNYNRYMMYKKDLYVLKTINPCIIQFSDSPIQYESVNEKEITVTKGFIRTYAYKQKEKWYMSTLNYSCNIEES